MQIPDFTWVDLLIQVALYPVYQIVSTARHELSHAFVVWMSGFDVTSIRIFPFRESGVFYWGRVTWTRDEPDDMPVPKYIHAMPYYVNLLCVLGAYPAMVYVQWEHFIAFAATLVMLFISPVVDTTYNVFKWLIYDKGDWAEINR